MSDGDLDRRSVLLGLGGVAGVSAAALVGGATPAAAQTGDESGVPTVKTLSNAHLDNGLTVQALPVVNPAWHYRTLAWHHFQPLASPLPGVSFGGATGMQATTAATFYAPLEFSQGSVVREVAFECYNAHPNTGLGLGFNRTDLGSGSIGGSFAFTTTNAGKHTIVLSSLNPFGIIDNPAYAYGLSAYLQPGAFGFFGARVAWEGGAQTTVLPTPVRKLDTRQAGGKIFSGQARNVSLAPELPTGATAALVNVTVSETESAGFLALFQGSTPWPGTSTINWSGPGQTIANTATVLVSSNLAIRMYCGGQATHVIIDLVGYLS